MTESREGSGESGRLLGSMSSVSLGVSMAVSSKFEFQSQLISLQATCTNTHVYDTIHTGEGGENYASSRASGIV